MSGNDGFLSRWSRRKRGEMDEPENSIGSAQAIVSGESTEGVPAGQADENIDDPTNELTDEEILEKYGLKDPEELATGDDFAGFMRSAIPDHIRRRALRKLWLSNPVLANLDGLNDYDDDFTGGSVAKGALKTAYEVGIGFARNVEKATGHTDSDRETEAVDISEEPETASESSIHDREVVSYIDPVTAEKPPESDELAENQRPAIRKRMKFQAEK